MEEEAQVAETTAEDTEVHEQAEQKANDKPPGYYPVSLDDVPENLRKPLEDRFGYFMRQINERKERERETERILRDYRGLAQDQSKKIEELMSATSKVVDHIVDRDASNNEAQIRQQMRAAREAGDYDTVDILNDKLLEAKAAKLVAKAQKPVQSQSQPVSQPQQNTVEDHYTKDDEFALSAWQSETDSSGNPLRPWASEGHPMYAAAFQEAKNVYTNPRYKNMTPEQKVAEIDRRMGYQPRQTAQTVMGGGLTPRAKTTKISLTPEQELFAKKSKFGSHRGAKSDAEYIEHYKKQLQVSKGTK